MELLPTRWWPLMTRVLNHRYVTDIILLQKNCWCMISRTTDGVKIYREPIRAIISCEMYLNNNLHLCYIKIEFSGL